jgi:hypothetical protein
VTQSDGVYYIKVAIPAPRGECVGTNLIGPFASDAAAAGYLLRNLSGVMQFCVVERFPTTIAVMAPEDALEYLGRNDLSIMKSHP